MIRRRPLRSAGSSPVRDRSRSRPAAESGPRRAPGRTLLAHDCDSPPIHLLHSISVRVDHDIPLDLECLGHPPVAMASSGSRNRHARHCSTRNGLKMRVARLAPVGSEIVSTAQMGTSVGQSLDERPPASGFRLPASRLNRVPSGHSQAQTWRRGHTLVQSGTGSHCRRCSNSKGAG
jgi:hypothetical protein